MLLPALLFALASAATPPEPAVIRTARFEFVSTPRSEDAAKRLGPEFERARDRIAELLGGDYPGVTQVRVGMGREEYESLAVPGGKPPSWAVALAYPGQNIVLVEARSLGTPDGPLTMRHELVHVALGQLGKGWPHWFQEGLAMELTGERKWRTDQLSTLTRAVAQGRVFHFEDLSAGFPESPDDVEIAYAQSAAFVDFLRARHGTPAFRHLIERVGAGDAFEKAFGVAFHVPLVVEEDAFRAELPRKYPWWPLLLSGESLLWGLTAGLVVLAFVRRRKAVRELRAEQLRVEVLHEEANQLLGHVPQNDDLETVPLDPFVIPIRVADDAPWIVYSVNEPEVPAADTAEKKAQ
ncbi:MAG: hypothetical protein U0228_32840 [Myxococcaceae bacterium]